MKIKNRVQYYTANMRLEELKRSKEDFKVRKVYSAIKKYEKRFVCPNC